jgi:hypothetical protein
MTQSTSDLRLPKISEMQKQYSVRDLYEISRGRREEWGIDSYKVPGTVQYLKKVHRFPTEKRADSYTAALKRKDWPDATTHSPSYQADLKRNWLKSGGVIPKGPKKTIIDMIMKEQKEYPGPGDYFKEPIAKKTGTGPDQT